MDIKYLINLKNLNSVLPSKYFPNESISLEEVSQLEQTYNKGNIFPKILKEYLLIAGKYCPVIDKGIFSSQQELQEFVREELEHYGKIFTRPFFAIEIYSGDWCLFIYLDEGDNPNLYCAYYDDEAAGFSEPLRKMGHNISSLINSRIQRIKENMNPY
jgi:hypothetical protein